MDTLATYACPKLNIRENGNFMKKFLQEKKWWATVEYMEISWKSFHKKKYYARTQDHSEAMRPHAIPSLFFLFLTNNNHFIGLIAYRNDGDHHRRPTQYEKFVISNWNWWVMFERILEQRIAKTVQPWTSPLSFQVRTSLYKGV